MDLQGEWARSFSIWLLLLPAISAVFVLAFKWRRLSRTSTKFKREAEESAILSRSFQELSQSLEAKYSNIIDVDQEIERRQKACKEEIAQATNARDRLLEKTSELRNQYDQKKSIYDQLVQELAVYDERLSFAELGIYHPHFDFSDSEEYKSTVLMCREQQKSMMSTDQAIVCPKNWVVDGSAAKGATMIKRGIKLTLRAFNNECEAAISNTRWNNVNAMEKRIVRAKEQIDKMNASNSIVITENFCRLKLEELYLTHEYREKQKEEKEERADLARAAREEQKLQRDLERAEQDESHYQKLLQRARTEADRAVGAKLDLITCQILELEKDLDNARAKVQRAQSLAERTRSGYVYIISNIGSFGEGIVKIGLTRRLDPQDRVRELGDASVPFGFDVHAIIYSDNAPALEHALHNQFEAGRVNAQNFRKEFFRASLDEVELAVARVAPDASFFKDIEAQEYRETLARRQAQLAKDEERASQFFPASI